MSTTSNHHVKYRSIEIFLVDPSSVLIPEDFQDRDTSFDEILEMAVSIQQHGQRRPVEGVRDSSGRWILAHGLIRVLAARLIVDGFVSRSNGSGLDQQIRDKRFRLMITATETQQSQPEPR